MFETSDLLDVIDWLDVEIADIVGRDGRWGLRKVLETRATEGVL